MNSLIIPVYLNEGSIPRLLTTVQGMYESLNGELEVVFVVDGSPDASAERLHEGLQQARFPAQLVTLSKNFGSFPAIRTGLQVARGEHFAVMAADLQEPPELILKMFEVLNADRADVVVASRVGRDDPLLSRWLSQLFWWAYRKFVMPQVPLGGVDVFGCNRLFLEHLLSLQEARSSLIGQIFWLGFRRETLSYSRLGRQEGSSAWNFRRKLDYLFDNVFSFSDLPIRILTRLGISALFLAFLMGLATAFARITGLIEVPGYTATLLAVLGFGGLNTLGLGIVGTYAWRAYENTKQRPLSMIQRKFEFNTNTTEKT